MKYAIASFAIMAVSFVYGQEQSPGAHLGQKCIDSEYTYDLYIPKAYLSEPKTLFPAVFISCPSGNPQGIFKELVNWAEKEKVLLVTVNQSKNGLGSGLKRGAPNPYEVMQSSIVKSVEKRCRLHPYLRFSIGASGAAVGSLRFAIRHKTDWAGVVLLIHSGNGKFAPKHCAVSFLAGEKDNTHPIGYVRQAYIATKAAGNPVHLVTYPDKGHGGIPPDGYRKELSWMLAVMKGAHPKITSKERSMLKPELMKKLKKMETLEDLTERKELIEELRYIPLAKKLKGYSTVVAGWYDIECARHENTEPPAKRWMALAELKNHKDHRLLDPKRRGKLSSTIRELERDKDVAKEKVAQSLLARIEKKHRNYTKRKKYKQLKRVKKEYDSLSKKYAGTFAAERAKSYMKMIR
jgi:hypothetical protein